MLMHNQWTKTHKMSAKNVNIWCKNGNKSDGIIQFRMNKSHRSGSWPWWTATIFCKASNLHLFSPSPSLSLNSFLIQFHHSLRGNATFFYKVDTWSWIDFTLHLTREGVKKCPQFKAPLRLCKMHWKYTQTKHTHTKHFD